MSVPKGKRNEGKLQVLNLCAQLTKYTLDIVKNEQCFPKRTKWQLPTHIIHEAIRAFVDIRDANSVVVVDRETYKERNTHQRHAHKHINNLLALIDLAYQDNNIPSNKIEYWTGLCVQTDLALHGWMRSDKTRFKEFTISDEDTLIQISKQLNEIIELLKANASAA